VATPAGTVSEHFLATSRKASRESSVLAPLGERRQQGGDDVGIRPRHEGTGANGIRDPTGSGRLCGGWLPLTGLDRREFEGRDPLRRGELLRAPVGQPLEDRLERRGDGVVMAGRVDHQHPTEGSVGLLDRRHRRFAAADPGEFLRGDPEAHPVAGDARPLLVE
jgi:hypothetical protein